MLAVALMALCMSVSGGSADTSDARKADYLYFEAIGMLQSATPDDPSKIDSYYMLLRRAHELDPEDPYIAADLAEMTLINNLSDSLEREEAYAAMQRRFRYEPENYYYSQLFADLAMKSRRFADAGEVWQVLDSLYPSKTEPAVNLADNYFYRALMGDTAYYGRALQIYDRLQAAQPANIDLASRKIKILSAMSDSAAVYKEVERVRSEAPKTAQTELFAGAVYNYFGQTDLARLHFDNARELDPEDGAVYITRADFFNSVNDSASYDREVFSALLSPTLDVDMKLQLLVDYVRNLYSDPDQRPRIEELFEQLLDVNPGEGKIHELYGIYFLTVGNLDNAVEQLGYAVDLEPSDEEFAETLMSAYAQKKDYRAMAETGEKAAAIHPESAQIFMMTSSAYMLDGRPAEGLNLINRFDMSSVSNPKLRSLIFGQRGDLLYAMGERDSSLVELDKAIDADPENYMAMNNAAYHLAVSGKNLEKARLYASMAAAGDPENPTVLDTYAWVMFRLKDYQEARTLIDRALTAAGILAPADDGSEENSQDEGGEEDDSDATPEEDADLSSEIYDHAGDIYFMTGEHRRALEFWEKALELDPENAAIARKVKYKTYFFEDED